METFRFFLTKAVRSHACEFVNQKGLTNIDKVLYFKVFMSVI